MAKRGRRSAAELSVLTPAEPPADAPYDLSDEAATIWREIMGALPANFIEREMFDILAAHCRHVATARFVSREIDRFAIAWFKSKGGVERLNKLSALRDREVRGMLATARSLRLTNQSRYRADTASTARSERPAGQPVPWDFRYDGDE